MITWLATFLQDDNTKLLYILSLILIANIIDFTVGIVNAKANGNVEFSSSKAKYGLLFKILMLIVLVYFIPVAMLAPDNIGLSALYVTYMGYLGIEINSILAHFRKAKDDKKGELFVDLMERIFGKKEN